MKALANRGLTVIQVVWLICTRTNPAVRLYQRQGYAVTSNEDYCCFTWCLVGIRVSHPHIRMLQIFYFYGFLRIQCTYMRI